MKIWQSRLGMNPVWMTDIVVLVGASFRVLTIGWRTYQGNFFSVFLDTNRRVDPVATRDNYDGMQDPDTEFLEGSTFLFLKSGKVLKADQAVWTEKWYEKGQIWVKSYTVII
jgi:hypothetical protein